VWADAHLSNRRMKRVERDIQGWLDVSALQETDERFDGNSKIAQWQKVKALVLDCISSPITKRVSNMALNEFMAWFQQAPRPASPWPPSARG
jgi:hypothetical protein